MQKNIHRLYSSNFELLFDHECWVGLKIITKYHQLQTPRITNKTLRESNIAMQDGNPHQNIAQILHV